MQRHRSRLLQEPAPKDNPPAFYTHITLKNRPLSSSCLQLIQKSTVKAQKALAPLSDHRLTLCGLSPAVILGAAHEGIQFCQLKRIWF